MSLLLQCHNRADLNDLLHECAMSTKITALTFFPQACNKKFSSLHDELFEAIDDPNKPFVAVRASRGLGKTALMRIFMARYLLFRHTNFIVYINKNYGNAKMSTNALRRMLNYNPLIKQVFGTIENKPVDADMSADFGAESWEAIFPGQTLTDAALVMPRGIKQPVRGLLYNIAFHRPGLVVYDDGEDMKGVLNEDLRADIEEYIITDLMRCFSQSGGDKKLVLVDSAKHPDSAFERVAERSDVHFIDLKLVDENYRTNAPDFMSQATVDQEVADARSSGSLDLYAREVQCLYISGENARFRKEHMNYYFESTPPPGCDQLLRELPGILNMVLCDPAKTMGEKSCDCAIVVIGVDINMQRLYLRDVICDQFTPGQIYDKIIDQAVKYKAVVCGLERTGLDLFIEQPFRSRVSERGLMGSFDIKFFSASGKDKPMRSAPMQKYFHNGQFYINQTFKELIVPSLLTWPRPKSWDVIDAMSYLTKVLGEGNKMFIPLGTGRDLPPTEEMIATPYGKKMPELDLSKMDLAPTHLDTFSDDFENTDPMLMEYDEAIALYKEATGKTGRSLINEMRRSNIAVGSAL